MADSLTSSLHFTSTSGLRDQTIRKVIRPIQIGNRSLIPAKIETADRTVIQHEPGLRCLCPGQTKNHRNQMNKESTMTEDCDAVLRLPFLVAVAGEQICQTFFGAYPALFLCFKWTAIPPAVSIQMIGKTKLRKMLLTISTNSSGQPAIFFISIATEDAA